MYIAKVVFFDAANGGRFTPPMSGFHPQITAGEFHTSCIVGMESEGIRFDFNLEHTVTLELMYPEEYGNLITTGSKIKFFEGDKMIGEGLIIGEKADHIEGIDRS
ncbi:hypothetical protein [Chitinivorax sp. B]|uniref:hypothetical protein n=1 Tax=Chitinivorax sp. B TaxID=2502235 RepID=UPI0010F683D0|nr:hypothetical protein [Chitinivorax sp. B]